MLNSRTSLLAAAAISVALTLAGCSAGTAEAPRPAASADQPDASAHNDADVMFAQMMIPHHEQAVEMSDVVLAKEGVDVRVTDLATRIKAAQEPEIEQLTSWLTAWGADLGEASGMDHGSEGMMSAEDLSALDEASGAEAARLFLEQMTVHHEGAIAMAEEQLDSGENAAAQALAAAIVTGQTEEIELMAEILSTL